METIQSTGTKVGNTTDNPKLTAAMKLGNRVRIAKKPGPKNGSPRPVTFESCLPMFAQGAVVADWFYTDSPVTEPGSTTEIPFGALRSFMESTGLLDEFIEVAEVKPLNRFEFFLAYHDEDFLQECVLKYMRKELSL